MNKPHAYYKALDKKGNLVFAKSDEAVAGEYFCRYCHCRMKLIPGRFYIRIPGEVHTDERCLAYENGKKEYGFANKTPNELIRRFCQPERGGRIVAPPHNDDDNPFGITVDETEENGGGDISLENIQDDKSEINIITNPSNPQEDIEEEAKESAYDSLRRIYEEEFEDMKYDSKVGEYRLSDYILTYYYAGKVLRRRNYELGYRIIFARFYAYSEYDNILIFRLFSQLEECCALFKIHVANAERYIELLDIFAPNTMNEGGSTSRKNNNVDVLLAGYWEKKDRCKSKCFLSKDFIKYGKVVKKGCFNSQCIGEWKAELINRGRQIYLIPPKNV